MPVAMKQLIFTACSNIVELLQLIELGARVMGAVPSINVSLINLQNDEMVVFDSFVQLYSCLGEIGFDVLLSLSCVKLEV